MSYASDDEIRSPLTTRTASQVRTLEDAEEVMSIQMRRQSPHRKTIGRPDTLQTSLRQSNGKRKVGELEMYMDHLESDVYSAAKSMLEVHRCLKDLVTAVEYERHYASIPLEYDQKSGAFDGKKDYASQEVKDKRRTLFNHYKKQGDYDKKAWAKAYEKYPSKRQ